MSRSFIIFVRITPINRNSIMSSFQIYIIKLDSNSPRDIKELSEWVSNQIESTPVECQDDRSFYVLH